MSWSGVTDVLPLRAILIGDRIPFGLTVVDRIQEGDKVELILSDGQTFEGLAESTIVVERIAVTEWDIGELVNR